jgi:hypothetical protein
MLFDYTKTWRLGEERLATETDPRRKQILGVMVEHMKAERSGDLDALMATVSPKAAYHTWGSSPTDNGAKGYDAVKQFYVTLLENDCGRVVHDVDRMTVGQDSIVCEGDLIMAFPGKVLAARGMDIDDPDSYYLYQSRSAIIWEFDEDGLVTAEDSYTTGNGFENMRKLDRGELPDLVNA